MTSIRYTGIGTRVLNFLIDTFIIFLLNMLVTRLHNWYVMYYQYRPINYWVFFGLTLFCYYFVAEFLFNRTIGKYFSYSIVIDANGAKPNILQILARSLVRLTIIDMFFIPFLDMPLHDYLSKTRLREI